ncbi:hypothetical protein [Bradyrhizobium neotropicale]|uniref:hypothetical protein n=1 Tax=Bradyrhizobium neotropicale TaxID=1497615 RepID=UPI001AD76024|nr:hypothetical protein [Bradyrhizobium neotropicale]MBO4228063.1 hypothetical protein [Bradyrhizobium neotropicale]
MKRYRELRNELDYLNYMAAQDEIARLKGLVEEIKAALRTGGAADDKVRWLIERLEI